MDSDPNRNVGRTDLSGKSDSVPAPRETAPIPAVTRPGAGPSSAMVTRSRAPGGRGMSVGPEIEIRPEVESTQAVEIPAETCDEGFGAARPTTDIASQYTIADKPEVTSYTSQEVTTSLTTPNPRNPLVHTYLLAGVPQSDYVTYLICLLSCITQQIPALHWTPSTSPPSSLHMHFLFFLDSPITLTSTTTTGN